MKRRFAITTAALATAAVLTGCMVGPNYQPPRVQMPAHFSASTRPATTQPTTGPAAREVDLERWWESFHDPVLNRLIASALQGNLDVQLAEARVREARAELEMNTATFWPTVDSSAQYSRSRFSQNAFAVGGAATGAGGIGTGGGSGAPTATAFSSKPTNLYQAGFDAAWELDVFGGTRRAIESARYAVESQIDARRNAMVTLLSEVALNYVALRGLQSERATVRDNVAAQRDTLSLIRAKFQAGIATDLDVARQEAQVASTESQLPTIETQIQQAIHRLGVLVARGPASLEAELAPPAPLPVGPPSIPAGLPSELLRRRPDVREAERQLAASTANIGVAVAELYPKFSLTGAVGLESLSLKTFTNSSSLFWSIGPQVSWRIFDAGQLWANIHVQNARQEEALIQYRITVLQAMQDVEDALVAYSQEQGRRERLEQAVQADMRAVDLAKQLNQAGVVDFLNVLTAEQALFLVQDALAQSNQTVQTDLVALYKALGGGWEVSEASAPQGPR